MTRLPVVLALLAVCSAAYAQETPTERQAAREVLQKAAEAMGGLARLQSLDNLVMTGFGQYVNQQGGGALSPDPHAPLKWAVAHDAERFFGARCASTSIMPSAR